VPWERQQQQQQAVKMAAPTLPQQQMQQREGWRQSLLDACRTQMGMQQQQQQVLLGRRGRSRLGMQHLHPRKGAGNARPQQQQQQRVVVVGGQVTLQLTFWRSWRVMAPSE
jgi:hypothetical protein